MRTNGYNRTQESRAGRPPKEERAMKPGPKRGTPTISNESPWRVRGVNYVGGYDFENRFRRREDAERFIEIRRRSIGGRVGEEWTVERQFGGVWLRADGRRS